MATKIYTSRYSNKEHWKDFEYYHVSISMGKPKYYIPYVLNEQIYMFAPSRKIFNLPEEEFNKKYKEGLDNYGVARVKSMIDGTIKRSNGRKVVFLCFEDIRVEGEFCHRTAFAEWVRDNIGYEVEELPDPSEPKVKKPKRAKAESPSTTRREDTQCKQLSLFDLYDQT